MPVIKRNVYEIAAKRLLIGAGFDCSRVSLGKLLASKWQHRLYVDVAGKNLPYEADGQEAFPWETHIRPDRLDSLETEARNHSAEPWIGFCYVIFSKRYLKDFISTVIVDRERFGLKLISASRFRSNMRSRSPSWKVLELPRDKVTLITSDPENI